MIHRENEVSQDLEFRLFQIYIHSIYIHLLYMRKEKVVVM